MHYLISGLAKSGTTILFSRIQQALDPSPQAYFEPHLNEQFEDILGTSAQDSNTLTKVLIGRVTSANPLIAQFDRHVLIHRDPRDQFISMLLYLFYDFQVSGDQASYDLAHHALAQKVADPAGTSTIELYNLLAKLVGRAPTAVFEKLHQEQKAYIQAFSPHLMRYEDFIDGEVSEVEHYLGFSVANQAKVHSNYQRVARSQGYGEWRNWLNADDLDYVYRRWSDTLKEFGYACDGPIGNLTIAQASSLDYVAQFNPGRQC